jgi:hypothetical protein
LKKLFLVSLLGFAPVFAATPCANMTVPAGGQFPGDMDVPANTTCQVQVGATVTGNVTVEGELVSNGGHFMGNVVVTGGFFGQPAGPGFTVPTIIDGDLTIGSNAWLRFTGASAMNQVKGNVTAIDPGRPLTGFDPGPPYFVITATTVGKNLSVSGATTDIVVYGVNVANNGIFTANEGALTLAANTFGLNLNGSDNAQAPTGWGNVAKHKNGQFSSLP